MTHLEQLRFYGLFDAKVPRYSSYPPANHFGTRVGAVQQGQWLDAVPDGALVSLYVHIPFCRQLCWFCASRTQATKTMRPVDAYVDILMREIDRVRARLPQTLTLSRLHLGGGTPTILSPRTMTRLLDRVFQQFAVGPGFEFSAEIDPTDSAPALLDVLTDHGLHRACIGVQDFDPRVQNAIGRSQTFDATHATIALLREANLPSLTMDLLYGLPHQTDISLGASLEQVLALQPDRLALYGYAHVPWMASRQASIDSSALPTAERRFQLAERARCLLEVDGFERIGIDHFTRPHDRLSVAKAGRRLRRTFQGYTDDAAEVLIGFGASAISRFPQGYSQNYPSTAQYTTALGTGGLAGSRGHLLTGPDRWVGQAIEQLLCYLEINVARLQADYPRHRGAIAQSASIIAAYFPQAVCLEDRTLRINAGFEPLTRIIAGKLDFFRSEKFADRAALSR